MIISTTYQIEGKKIVAYHGIQAGETILGANVIKDFLASMSDFFGGRSSTYERELVKARDTSVAELEERAAAVGGNAVVGIQFNYLVIGEMLMVSATGTVVTVE